MRHGDITDDMIKTAQPEDVIRQYTPWVKKIALKYNPIVEQTGAVDLDDLEQVGCLALLKARETYDPANEKSFIGWSSYFIRNAMREALGFVNRRMEPPPALVYLDAPLNDETDDTLLDTLTDPDAVLPEEAALEEDLKREVQAAVDRLKSDKQKEVIKRCRLAGQDRAAAAADMGITVKAVHSLDKEGRRMLRRDHRLREYAMPFFHVGVDRFNTTWTSAVEAVVLWREKHLAPAPADRHDPDGV